MIYNIDESVIAKSVDHYGEETSERNRKDGKE